MLNSLHTFSRPLLKGSFSTLHLANIPREIVAQQSNTTLVQKWLTSFLVSSKLSENLLKPTVTLAEHAKMLPLLSAIVKHTVLRNYACDMDLQKVHDCIFDFNRNNIGAIPCFSAEDAVCDYQLEKNARAIAQSVTLSSLNEYPGPSLIGVKPTSIWPTPMLRKMSKFVKENGEDLFQDLPSYNTLADGHTAFAAATGPELAQAVRRLDPIVRKAARFGVHVLLDAEHSQEQPGVNLLAMALMKHYNRDGPLPLLYSTHQMYLKESLKNVRTAIETAHNNSFQLGLKLVRGAYMEQEEQFAREQLEPSPCFSVLEDTHCSYNEAAELMLETALAERGAVVVATHNQDSMESALTQLTTASSFDKHNPRVVFSQLMGMGSHLTYALAHLGFNSTKYLPYGPVDFLIPYLLRRLSENVESVSHVRQERALLWDELKLRLTEPW